MAKPKITRLGDPANPYTKKKVTREQAAASAEASRKAAPAPKPAPGEDVRGFMDRARSAAGKVRDALDPVKRFGPGAQRTMKKANEEYNAARKKKINRAVDR